VADCFVGRQPIFDVNNRVFAYDLLYRSSLENRVGDVNLTVATSRVIIDAFVEIGLDSVVGRNRVLLNVDKNFLIDPDLVFVPAERVALQLPQDLEPTEEIRAGVEHLRSLGYKFAIGGYTRQSPVAAYLPYASIVKIDALDRDDATLAAELESIVPYKVVKVAKRVETAQRRDQLVEMGFDCFQGHFLARPEVVTGQRMPSNRIAVLELVTKILDPDLGGDELAQLIAMDASLSLRTLRFVNSPLSGLNNEVESIHHAVVLLGRNIIKSWVMLLAITGLDNNVPELVTTAFVRAKLCERLAGEASLPGTDSFFTVGLFSLMDALMGMPMGRLLDTLPFSAEVKSALDERAGIRGEAVSCAENLEQGAPDGASFQSLSGEQIGDLYLEAVNWADNAMASIR
jgi:EAL and modified HD-GYP domain-containing signal transduction protein